MRSATRTADDLADRNAPGPRGGGLPLRTAMKKGPSGDTLDVFAEKRAPRGPA